MGSRLAILVAASEDNHAVRALILGGFWVCSDCTALVGGFLLMCARHTKLCYWPNWAVSSVQTIDDGPVPRLLCFVPSG